MSSIHVRALTDTGPGTILYIYYNHSGTRRNVGHIIVPAGQNPANGNNVWEGIWNNPNAQYPMKSGDTFDIAALSGSTVYHGYATGGDF